MTQLSGHVTPVKGLGFGEGVAAEEALPLYRSYITWSHDHLSVALIGCGDRKWNGYPRRGGSEEFT